MQKCCNADVTPKKPENLDEMISLSKILCQGFTHVRVDFYNVNGKIYFGEMTFTSANGGEIPNPESFDQQLGEYIKLPEKYIPVLK